MLTPMPIWVDGLYSLKSEQVSPERISLSEQGLFAELIMVISLPVPAAVWLFGSGLLGLVGISRRKKIA